MRRTFLWAGIVAAVLVLSSGTAFAAHKYVITSSTQVKNGVLTANDLSAHARASLRGNTGATGAAGPAGISNYHQVSQNEAVSVGDTSVTVACPVGQRVLGGGYAHGVSNDEITFEQSRPTSDGTGWYFFIHNSFGGVVGVTAYAICATVAP